MIIPVKTTIGKYDIIIERGALSQAGNFFKLDRKCFILTDSGVPKNYAEAIQSQCREGFIMTIPQGEKSKTTDTLLSVLEKMVLFGLTRSDCLISVGGGVVGDMGGFAAACYMRGIDFYNVPTTVLSQVDSSIGGKTAVDFAGYKNIIGAFHQPKAVILDADTLKTLPDRQISNGLAEALKMSMTSDPELFDIFENGNPKAELEKVIYKSILIKRAVVEEDEKEAGLRKILNFGHTLAHAIESVNKMENFYHGECVAAGMMPMCGENIQPRLLRILKSLNLPSSFDCPIDEILEAVGHDKKMSGDRLTVILVPEIGRYKMEEITVNELRARLGKAAIL